jgi:hypothetical protein
MIGRGQELRITLLDSQLLRNNLSLLNQKARGLIVQKD